MPETNASAKMEFFTLLRFCVKKKNVLHLFGPEIGCSLFTEFYTLLNEVEVEMVGRGWVGGHECVGVCNYCNFCFHIRQ